MRKPQHYRALQDFIEAMTCLILPFHISLSTFTAFRRLFHGVANSIETTAEETAKQTVNDCMRLRSDKTIGGLKHLFEPRTPTGSDYPKGTSQVLDLRGQTSKLRFCAFIRCTDDEKVCCRHREPRLMHNNQIKIKMRY